MNTTSTRNNEELEVKNDWNMYREIEDLKYLSELDNHYYI